MSPLVVLAECGTTGLNRFTACAEQLMLLLLQSCSIEGGIHAHKAAWQELQADQLAENQNQLIMPDQPVYWPIEDGPFAAKQPHM